MSAKPLFTISGDEKLLRVLGQFSKTGASQAINRAVMTVASKAVAALRASAPKGPTGTLKKAIKKKVYRNARADSVVAVVGADKAVVVVDAKGIAHRPSKYLHLIESGRAAVSVKKARVLSNLFTVFGRTARAVAPNPIMERVASAIAPAVVPTVNAELQKQIGKQLR